MPLIIAILLTISGSVFAEETSINPDRKTVSGVVRLIRGEPETEVFFKDLKDSVIIPKDSHHNEIFALCNDSMKTGKSVSLQMDIKSHRVYLPPKKPPVESKESSDQGLD